MKKGRKIPAKTRKRILSARKTTSEREFRLMLALRPERKTVIAEGDSWFAYPSPNLVGANSKSNIVNHLAADAELNLLQLASNGDEAVQMMAGKSKHRLAQLLARYPVDYLLFSGGGNDVVGRYDLDYLLRNGGEVQGENFRAHLHLDRVRRRISAVGSAYRDLVDYCDEYSANPDVRIVTHTYDYPIPSPRGATFLGGLVKVDGGRSWMHPYLLAKQIPSRHHRPVATYLIDCLAESLLALQAERPDRLSVVDTRGTLQENDWRDEIHPDREGFGKIAARIAPCLG